MYPLCPRLTELARVFLKLGTIGFGGPAAHIAMLEAEIVTRRQWISQAQFLDLIGLTNLIPGPSSTELAIYIGYLRAGWWGLIVAGVCFIVPAMAIVWGMAIVYERINDLPQAIAMFAGIKPVVVVLTIQAMWKLRISAIKNLPTGIAGVVTIALIGVFDVNTLIVLLVAGFGVMVWQNWRNWGGGLSVVWLPKLDLPILAIVPAIASQPSWVDVFTIFLKIGATIYGGGYVLLAFLQSELVERTQWLTSTQLLDAIAIGQVTPGPLFTTATFIGYLLAGHAGALAATIGIFLPSFIFVVIVTFWAPKLRQSVWFRSWLDGVNAGAWGAIAVVAYRLGVVTLVDWLSISIAAIGALLIWRWRVDPLWPILVGATIGLLGQLARSHH
ncbi:chromate transporter, chromate ion transporter family [Chamaesiphon minutus PCC 6605]|uniref:Chromate transporter, chromate ion transporter family n=1 Tax=Chamaesiphon minutus (strain ATCC 27169 / PCC 6605) TaxID=1173020 RepID=K9UID3_CHAP6|nr:chromate transporter, chromate ion transporter family [Chamaesiphon minutus PCC 6605]